MNNDLLKMLTELEGITERIDKTNKQRMTMVLLITNLMKHEDTSMHLKSAMVATMMDMLEEHMIQEDGSIIKLINEAIDFVCEEAQSEGVYNLREKLNDIRKQVGEQLKRQEEGNSILKSLNLNDINLN